MSPIKRRYFFYFMSYALIVVIALFCLFMNIKTVPIVEERQQVVLQKQWLEEENRELLLKIESLTSLENVEKKATKHLHMVRPKRIINLK